MERCCLGNQQCLPHCLMEVLLKMVVYRLSCQRLVISYVNQVNINIFFVHHHSYLYVLALTDTCSLHLLKSYFSFKGQLKSPFLREVPPTSQYFTLFCSFFVELLLPISEIL